MMQCCHLVLFASILVQQLFEWQFIIHFTEIFLSKLPLESIDRKKLSLKLIGLFIVLDVNMININERNVPQNPFSHKITWFTTERLLQQHFIHTASGIILLFSFSAVILKCPTILSSYLEILYHVTFFQWFSRSTDSNHLTF